MEVLKLLVAFACVATTCCGASRDTTGETVRPQHLIGDQESTFSAFSDAHKLGKDILSWSEEVNSAIGKHFFYDTVQYQPLQRLGSNIFFSCLSHSEPIRDAFLAVMSDVDIVQSFADSFSSDIQSARLDRRQVLEAKCYCEQFKAGWYHPADKVVDLVIDGARSQTVQYLSAARRATSFLFVVELLGENLHRLDKLIAREDSFQNMNGPAAIPSAVAKPSREGQATLEQIRKLRKQIGKSFNRKFNRRKLETALEVIRMRNETLTTLAKLDVSYERSQASIDLACAMAEHDKYASIVHAMAYGRARLGFCPITG